MAEAKAVITAIPVFVPEDQILFPLIPKPDKPDIPIIPFPEPTARKGLVFNIEATGFDPLRNRVISIGLQDPLKPEYNPTVLMIDDEKELISVFFEVLKSGGYNELIGYGLSYDYRFMLIKAMKYGLNCKEFYDCALYDLMQACAQGKLAYVYFPQRALKLSEVADYFWSYPKPFTDTEMLKYYAAGVYDKVVEFTSGQITRILALYMTFRNVIETPITSFSSGVISGNPISTIPQDVESGSMLTIPEVSNSDLLSWKCDQCFAEWSDAQLDGSTKCPICGEELKRL